MFYFRRFAQCGILVAMLTVFSNVAAAFPISSFSFNGSLQVAAGAGLNPATITFNPVVPGSPGFTIISQNGGVGDLVGLTGSISGDYEFDDPDGANSVVLTSPTFPKTFTIDDGTNLFTADIDLFQLQGGGGGSIFGAIDFSSSEYFGSNAALIALDELIQNAPNLTVTFQVGGAINLDLDDLFDNGSGGTVGFSAVASVIPEPAPLALLGLGLLCSVGFIRRRRFATKR